MANKLIAAIGICLLTATATFAQTAPAAVNGEIWLDTDGNPINAHGGGILYHNGRLP